MKRYEALDFLRGISIFGMVFCSVIPYGVLPGWMYHIQTPPPTHAVDLTLVGLSWVDLVFPVFIFCMGVAISLSGHKKLSALNKENSKEMTKSYLLHTFERFLLLWLFSYLYVMLNYGNLDSPGAWLLTIAGFLSLFPIYMIVKNSRYRVWIRVAGILLSAVIIYFGHTIYEEVVSINRSGIIIFLLAFLYLFASLIWFYTRKNIRIRAAIFAILLLFAAITMHYEFAQKLYKIESVKWFFNIEYIYFLMILLPATWLGDMLVKRLEDKSPISVSPQFAAISLFMVAWQCYALYMRIFWINIAVTVAMLAAIYYFIKRGSSGWADLFYVSSVMLLAGLIIDPLEGGIQKSPCTISYCLVTFSCGVYLLWFSAWFSARFGKSAIFKIFTGSGGNPLMSYIAYNSFMMPLFKLTGFIFIYKAAFPQSYPWIGVASAALFVLIMMWGVTLLTDRKIIWRA